MYMPLNSHADTAENNLRYTLNDPYSTHSPYTDRTRTQIYWQIPLVSPSQNPKPVQTRRSARPDRSAMLCTYIARLYTHVLHNTFSDRNSRRFRARQRQCVRYVFIFFSIILGQNAACCTMVILLWIGKSRPWWPYEFIRYTCPLL